MRVRLPWLFCCFIACCCSAQTNQVHTNARSLKLEECIDLALANNLDVQIQRLNTDIASYSLTASYGAYDPSFSMFARRDFLSAPAEIDPKNRNPNLPYE